MYVRVSTAGQSRESQIERLRAEKDRHGWTHVQLYGDTASGGTIKRGGLDDLMEAVRAGKVDAVVVTRLDRLGRSLVHLAQIIGELRSRGVALVAVDQGIDTRQDNPTAALQWQILGAVAEFERSLIRERTRAGLDAAKARGVRLGRPPGKGLPDRRKAAARRIFREDPGLSIPKLARAAGISVGTAHKWRKEFREEAG